MSKYFELVKSYLQELGYQTVREDEAEELVVIDLEEQGIKNLIIDCEYPIVVLEQFIFTLPQKTAGDVAVALLKWNRNLVHGAFALDDSGERVIFRDTLQLENLDLNELEASINALSLAMAEYSDDILKFARS